MRLSIARSRTGAMAVPRDVTGIDDGVSGTRQLDDNIGVSMHREIAVTVGTLAGAVRTVTGAAGEAAMVAAVVAGDIREC